MQERKKVIPSLVKDPKLIEKRREQIIEAAVDLFIHKGFHKTTTREIARASGFSIGTLYEYIESKEDILYLVCDSIHNEMEERLREAITYNGSGLKSLKLALKSLIRVMDQVNDRVLLIYQETKSLPHEAMTYVLRREESITGIFEEILHKGMEDGSIRTDERYVKLMANNIMVLAEMWVFRRWTLGKSYTLDEYIEKQTELLLRDISGHE
ncbi:TetR/AcrR family transcriptional regulator [Brevibacillus sp. 7WMA2]|uniref:HTH-type transcriptional repressor KstR2 n=2 Tax=Brevibacillus laterosporus TaxID=1465 RepID=A0A075R827_BRELA|nr:MULTISPECIES: TetR/AcrR family transcriptional regulator [Brevibacillus]MBA4531781.1 TetR/AcrR family transcriptional regulator [Brevibacillus halotolerans]AIG28732.1 HTH-type transcriptional repressor KstR2 [Brevibacillus laterosporus LMG 15441]ATO49207.1 TetR family transcriptional regulator [Brevibacillus laterosporus DSM 25]AUM67058.1 TetR/AcrR family transcriptional regulator [Brevibacillus laterosporus]AYB40708.1 TetR/AcrR family transcriptional regulator [Brevibacillus laterosporus]